MKYRILEVEGEYRIHKYYNELELESTITKYIPKYIVQERLPPHPLDTHGQVIKHENLKEFTNIEEARKYKRELELKNGGIVIE